MHTDTTLMKKPTGEGNPTAGHTDTTTVPTGSTADKAFQTMRAAFALRGHAFFKVDHKDGPATYWAERWGLVRYLPTLDDARRFLEQIGGRL